MLSQRLTYLITACLLLLTHVTSHADCENYLSSRPFDLIQKSLAESGSPLDREVLKALIEFHKLIPLPANDLARAPQDHLPPRSPYIKPNESWDSLVDYFYNSPSSLTVTRIEDLNYLRHLLGVAQMRGPAASRQEILSQAHREWHLSRLSRFSPVRDDFLKWENSRNIDQLINELERKIKQWPQKTGLSAIERQTRSTVATKAFNKIKSLNSAFDLYVIEKYLSLLTEKGNLESQAQAELNSKLQFTDWRGFSTNLAVGSFDFIVNFIESASHDTELKAYLAMILLKMESSERQHHNQNFATAFESSRWHVNSELEDITAPEQYESNLSIFTLVGQRAPSAPYDSPMVAEIQVEWNPKLGRLEAWMANAVPLKKNLRVKDNPRLMMFLSRYFDYFKSGSSYKKAEIDEHLRYEEGSALARNTYVVFTRPEFPDDVVSMVKIFNGSTFDFTDPELKVAINRPEEMLSSIETLFPHLKFEEREQGVPVLEIGRMLAHPQETKPQAFPILMARIADLLYRSGARGMTYFYGVERIKDHHVKEGAEVVYSPEELRLAPETEAKWIMRMSVQDLATKYFSRIFEAVRLRRPPPQYLVDSPTPEMIHSHVQFDLPGDLHAEAAILNNEDSDASLLITHRQGDDVRHEVILDNPNLGLVVKGLYGTHSHLETRNGRLVIHQQNESVGRHRWQRQLEVDFINGEYVVTRFTYSDRDTLDTRLGGSCDYDLINGTGVKNSVAVNITKTRIKLKTLSDHEALYNCSGW